MTVAVVIISSGVYCLVAFSKLSELLSRAVPETLKHGITCGIGLFLVVIGLEKGHLIEARQRYVYRFR